MHFRSPSSPGSAPQSRLSLRAAGALVVAAAAVSAPLLAQDRYNTDDYRTAARALMCQCGGCRALVHECAMDRCPSSEPIREEITERLQAGESVDEVVGRFRDRYGLQILAAPPTSGFHLSAWVLPFAVLLVGGLAAAAVLARWKGSGIEPETAPEAVPAELAARIERDIDRIR